MRWLVLNFHGIGDPVRDLEPGEPDVWLSRDRFTEILDICVDRDDVLLTFDDGNSSDLRIAASELEKRGMSATFFVLTGKFGAKGYLSPQEVRELHGRGHKIGSHGRHHVDWRSIDEAQLEEEIKGSRLDLEDLLQTSVSEFAVPFGSYDRRVLGYLEAEKPSAIYTSDGGRWDGQNQIIPRHSLRSQDDADSVDRASQHSRSSRDRLVRRLKRVVKRLR